MGDLLRVKYDNQLSEGLLRVLFMYDLHNLDQMLEDVLAGQEWKGVIQVGGWASRAHSRTICTTWTRCGREVLAGRSGRV
jgi:hypothetical protein